MSAYSSADLLTPMFAQVFYVIVAAVNILAYERFNDTPMRSSTYYSS